MFIILAILNILQAKPILPSSILLAIDCGSTLNTTSSYSKTFQSDSYYSSNTFTNDSQLQIFKKKLKILDTQDPKIYSTYRYSNQDFYYHIPFPPAYNISHFVLILQFLEVEYDSPNQRVFTILLGDTPIIQNLDLSLKKGKLHAYDEYLQFEYNDSEIYFQQKKCLNAIENGQLMLKFEQQIGNPVISGIMLIKGTIEDTDYMEKVEEYESQLEKKSKVNERKIKMKEKKELLKVREGFEQEVEEIEKKNRIKWIPDSLQELKDILMSPMGILGIISLLMMSFILIAFAFFDPYNIKHKKQH